MQTWFECKVKYAKVDQDGRERKVTESYLIDAVSFTDAEARLTEKMKQLAPNSAFAVKDIKESNVIEIFPSEEGGWWYKAKLSLVTIDERAGKEKKIINYMLVEADNIKQALERLEEGMHYILVPVQITELKLSPVCDVFPYFNEEEASDER